MISIFFIVLIASAPVISSQLATYILDAQKNSASLKALNHMIQSQSHSVHVVSALPDPVFMYAYQYDNIETKTGPQNHRFGLKQPIPFPGKLSLKEDVATFTTKSSRQQLQQLRNRVTFEVKRNFALLYLYHQKIGYIKKNITLLEQEYVVIQNKYESSLAPYSNLYMTANMIDKLKRMQGSVERELNKTLSDLRYLCGYGDEILFEPPTQHEMEIKETAVPAIVTQQLLTELLQQSPNIKSLTHKEEAQQATVALQRRNYFPDIALGVDYIQTGAWKDTEIDPLIFNVSLTLPLNLVKRSHAVSQASEDRNRTRLDKEDTMNRLTSQAYILIENINNARENIELYKNQLIPRTEKYLKINTAYLIGSSRDYQDYLEVQKELYENYTALAIAQTELYIHSVAFELLLGVSNEHN